MNKAEISALLAEHGFTVAAPSEDDAFGRYDKHAEKHRGEITHAACEHCGAETVCQCEAEEILRRARRKARAMLPSLRRRRADEAAKQTHISVFLRDYTATTKHRKAA